MACHYQQFTIQLIQSPACPTQIAIEDVVMCLMQCGTTSIAGVQPSMHSLCISINPLFHPFTPPLVSMLFTHRPPLHSWLAIRSRFAGQRLSHTNQYSHSLHTNTPLTLNQHLLSCHRSPFYQTYEE